MWRGASGIGNEDPRAEGRSEIERWCNSVASEVLVPREDLAATYPQVGDRSLAEGLDELARTFRCGTLVVLQALQRTGVRRFDDFTDVYDAEVARLRALHRDRDSGGGDHYHNQPFRVGERLSRALIADALEGRTSIEEAMRLMSVKSLGTLDEYARRLGAA